MLVLSQAWITRCSQDKVRSPDCLPLIPVSNAAAVIITLSVVDGASTFAVPRRNIVLSKERPTVTIGRSSKRDSSLGASEHNAWIDSPVMSRDHAQLRFNAENQVCSYLPLLVCTVTNDLKAVSLTDIGSLHGTFYNGATEPIKASQELKDGDTVAFGVRIERGETSFHQCKMNVGLKFGEKQYVHVGPFPTTHSNSSNRASNGPMVFQVPDDSDVESVVEALGAEEDRSIRESIAILEEHDIAPAQKVDYIQSSDPIDLTAPDWDSPLNLERDDSQSTPPTSPPDQTLIIEAEIDGEDEGCVADDADLFGSDLGDEDIPPSHTFAPAGFVCTGIPFPGNSNAETVEEIESDFEDDEIVEDALFTAGPQLSKVDQILQQVDLGRISRMREERVRCLTQASIDIMKSKQAEEASKSALAASTVPAKRKASEISEDASAGNITNSEAPPVTPNPEAVNQSSKRLRRVAEAVGFAALGGIAVVTALIATAPAL